MDFLFDLFDFIFSYSEKFKNISLIIFPIIGLYFINKRIKIADRQAITAEANHVTDIFNKSIEQLGSYNAGEPSIERRIGAIFALEKTAMNNQNYYSQVIDILCAYVRLHAPLKDEKNESNLNMREDIQVALTVICKSLPDEINNRPNINLSNTDLSRADLTEANLKGANLRWANLTHAKLEEANLTEAELFGAKLSGAKLRKTNFTNAELGSTDLKYANLTETNFEYADLDGADLTEATIQNTNFYKSKGQYNEFQNRSKEDWKTLDLKNLTLPNA